MEPFPPAGGWVVLAGALGAVVGLAGGVVWNIARALRAELLGSVAPAGTGRGD